MHKKKKIYAFFSFNCQTSQKEMAEGASSAMTPAGAGASASSASAASSGSTATASPTYPASPATAKADKLMALDPKAFAEEAGSKIFAYNYGDKVDLVEPMQKIFTTEASDTFRPIPAREARYFVLAMVGAAKTLPIFMKRLYRE